MTLYLLIDNTETPPMNKSEIANAATTPNFDKYVPSPYQDDPDCIASLYSVREIVKRLREKNYAEAEQVYTLCDDGINAAYEIHNATAVVPLYRSLHFYLRYSESNGLSGEWHYKTGTFHKNNSGGFSPDSKNISRHKRDRCKDQSLRKHINLPEELGWITVCEDNFAIFRSVEKRCSAIQQALDKMITLLERPRPCNRATGSIKPTVDSSNADDEAFYDSLPVIDESEESDEGFDFSFLDEADSSAEHDDDEHRQRP